VDYATSDGSGVAGTDYTASSGTLTFGTGVTTQSFSVPVVNDTARGDRTVNLTLANPTGGASLGTLKTEVLTIQTGAPQVSFSAASYLVSETGKTATITVKRTGPLTGAGTVNYATSDGTATAPGDYTSTSGTLSFTAGVASKTFTVAVSDDALLEGDETVNLPSTANTRSSPPRYHSTGISTKNSRSSD